MALKITGYDGDKAILENGMRVSRDLLVAQAEEPKKGADPNAKKERKVQDVKKYEQFKPGEMGDTNWQMPMTPDQAPKPIKEYSLEEAEGALKTYNRNIKLIDPKKDPASYKTQQEKIKLLESRIAQLRPPPEEVPKVVAAPTVIPEPTVPSPAESAAMDESIGATPVVPPAPEVKEEVINALPAAEAEAPQPPEPVKAQKVDRGPATIGEKRVTETYPPKRTYYESPIPVKPRMTKEELWRKAGIEGAQEEIAQTISRETSPDLQVGEWQNADVAGKHANDIVESLMRRPNIVAETAAMVEAKKKEIDALPDNLNYVTIKEAWATTKAPSNRTEAQLYLQNEIANLTPAQLAVRRSAVLKQEEYEYLRAEANPRKKLEDELSYQSSLRNNYIQETNPERKAAIKTELNESKNRVEQYQERVERRKVLDKHNIKPVLHMSNSEDIQSRLNEIQIETERLNAEMVQSEEEINELPEADQQAQSIRAQRIRDLLDEQEILQEEKKYKEFINQEESLTGIMKNYLSQNEDDPKKLDHMLENMDDYTDYAIRNMVGEYNNPETPEVEKRKLLQIFKQYDIDYSVKEKEDIGKGTQLYQEAVTQPTNTDGILKAALGEDYLVGAKYNLERPAGIELNPEQITKLKDLQDVASIRAGDKRVGLAERKQAAILTNTLSKLTGVEPKVVENDGESEALITGEEEPQGAALSGEVAQDLIAQASRNRMVLADKSEEPELYAELGAERGVAEKTMLRPQPNKNVKRVLDLYAPDVDQDTEGWEPKIKKAKEKILAELETVGSGSAPEEIEAVEAKREALNKQYSVIEDWENSLKPAEEKPESSAEDLVLDAALVGVELGKIKVKNFIKDTEALFKITNPMGAAADAATQVAEQRQRLAAKVNERLKTETDPRKKRLLEQFRDVLGEYKPSELEELKKAAVVPGDELALAAPAAPAALPAPEAAGLKPSVPTTRGAMVEQLGTIDRMKNEFERLYKIDEAHRKRLTDIDNKHSAMLQSLEESRAKNTEDIQKKYTTYAAQLQEGIDPGRFWRNASDGQKIAMIIGMALSGLGASIAGRDPIQAMSWFNNLIEMDIQAQMEDTERLRVGLSALENVFSLTIRKYDNSEAALETARAAAWGAVQKEIEAAKAEPKFQLKMIELDQLKAQAQAQAAAANQKAIQNLTKEQQKRLDKVQPDINKIVQYQKAINNLMRVFEKYDPGVTTNLNKKAVLEINEAYNAFIEIKKDEGNYGVLAGPDLGIIEGFTGGNPIDLNNPTNYVDSLRRLFGESPTQDRISVLRRMFDRASERILTLEDTARAGYAAPVSPYRSVEEDAASLSGSSKVNR